jgi:hypothetical protein
MKTILFLALGFFWNAAHAALYTCTENGKKVLRQQPCAEAPPPSLDKTRPASGAEFIGVFRLLDYPLADQPKVLKQAPWRSACQFFGHYPDGYWLHQQTDAGSCTSAIPSTTPVLPQTAKWTLVRNGFVLIDRKDRNIREVWKLDRVTRPLHIGKTNLNEGDIIMQLLDNELKSVLWIRLLRRVGDARL